MCFLLPLLAPFRAMVEQSSPLALRPLSRKVHSNRLVDMCRFARTGAEAISVGAYGMLGWGLDSSLGTGP